MEKIIHPCLIPGTALWSVAAGSVEIVMQSLSPFIASAGSCNMDHIPLPENILDLKLSGLILLLKMGLLGVTYIFNMENQVNVTLEFLLLGLEVHDGLVSNPGKIF